MPNCVTNILNTCCQLPGSFPPKHKDWQVLDGLCLNLRHRRALRVRKRGRSRTPTGGSRKAYQDGCITFTGFFTSCGFRGAHTESNSDRLLVAVWQEWSGWGMCIARWKAGWGVMGKHGDAYLDPELDALPFKDVGRHPNAVHTI